MPFYKIDGLAPTLPESGRFWIAPDVQIVGDVRFGEDASVWFGSVLRGDNDSITLGAGSNIQDGCLVHTDPGFPVVLGAHSSVGHGVMLHGCSIGEKSLIGMRAIILNGAKIGNNCLVGAGSLITEGKEFPDNSLIIGSPARVMRTLEEKDLKRMQGAAGYVARWQRYKKGLVVRNA